MTNPKSVSDYEQSRGEAVFVISFWNVIGGYPVGVSVHTLLKDYGYPKVFIDDAGTL